jgi:GNAT superfamily N-acetyltransferase
MTTDFTIRSAQQSDLAKMVELLQQLFSIEEDFYVDPGKQRSGLELLLKSENAQIFVVDRANEKTIAMVSLQLAISTAEGGVVGWVEDVVVAAPFRGCGIGKHLLEHIWQWARTRNIKRLQLVADRTNKAALDFYKKHDWSETNLQVFRLLTEVSE